MWDVAVSVALLKCPFLQEMAKKHGEQYARDMVLKPHEQISPSTGRPLFGDGEAFVSTVSLFHGTNGVLPLPTVNNSRQQDDKPVETADSNTVKDSTPTSSFSFYRALASAPLAAISIAAPGMPGPGDWFRRKNSSGRDERPKHSRGRPSMHFSAAVGSAGLSAAAGCPLRKWLGPLAPVVFNSAGNFKCPEAIVQMRAALSRSQPVRELRPQSLPIKFLAVGATAALVNIPFGALREQYEKFSPGWFLAVHATIPFIAMLRKAVLMPKFAIVCTIAAAIAGQAIGARMARAQAEQNAHSSSMQHYSNSAGPVLPARHSVGEENPYKSKVQLIISDLQEKMKDFPGLHSLESSPLVDEIVIKV